MTDHVRVLELRSVRGTGGGPEKTILEGARRARGSRFETIVCYIRDRRDDVFRIDQRAAALGVDYVEIHERHSFDRSIWPALRRLVRTRRIDIVHAHDYKTNLLAYLLAKAEGVAPLSTVHGWNGRTYRERLVYYPSDRRLLARFPHLIAVSSGLKSQLVGAGARAHCVSVVLNGIDPQAYRRRPGIREEVRRELGVGSREFVVGSIGRLEHEKRFDLLIDSIADLLPARPNLVLAIAGDGSLRLQLTAYAELRLPPHAYRFLGHSSDVGRLHHGLDLFVQASDSEGTPNALLEAMALETPLVATAVGGTTELVAHGVDGLIVSPGNAALLGACINNVWDDPPGAAARAQSARRRVEKELSFDRRMERIESVYTNILARKAAVTSNS